MKYLSFYQLDICAQILYKNIITKVYTFTYINTDAHHTHTHTHTHIYIYIYIYIYIQPLGCQDKKMSLFYITNISFVNIISFCASE